MTLDEFVRSGHDPTSVAVVAEDAAAVAGCAIASAALMATQHSPSSVFDAAGSIAVGGLLGTTAMYLINSNRLLLLGRSLGPEKMEDNGRGASGPGGGGGVPREERGARAGDVPLVAEIEFSGSRVVERYWDQGDGAKREQLHGVFRSAVEEGARAGTRGRWTRREAGGRGDRGRGRGGSDREGDREVEPSIHYVDLETN